MTKIGSKAPSREAETDDLGEVEEMSDADEPVGDGVKKAVTGTGLKVRRTWVDFLKGSRSHGEGCVVFVVRICVLRRMVRKSA